MDISKYSFIYIATLCTLAISHPIYNFFTQEDHATFFVAHQSKAIDVYFIVVGFSIFLPLILFLACAFVRLFSLLLARILYALILTILFILLCLLTLANMNVELGGINLGIATVFGLAMTVLFFFKMWVRSALSIISVAVIVSPLIFLNNPAIRFLIASHQTQNDSLLSENTSLPNIVLLIFDELPLTSLLDENRLIDDLRYPNFARLAARSHWFRNTSTTHYSTRGGALPSILTGWYPKTYRKNALVEQTDTNAPIQKQNMPNSIFSFLESTHTIVAVEPMSQLAPENQLIEKKGPHVSERILSLSCDALVVYAHLVAPDDLKTRLPTIHGQWTDFCSLSGTQLPPSIEWPYVDEGSTIYAKQFIESLGFDQEPTFYFLHLLLPHFPFKYDMNGEIHEAKTNIMSGLFRRATGENHWGNETVANLTYQAHLIQLVFTDQLLGRILDRLEAVDLFESSIIIVTADHGATFFWDSNGIESDDLKKVQASDTMYVPLFIKMPNQVTGTISDRQVETIDILPTLAESLGLEIAWQPDGINAFSSEEPDRERIAMLPREVRFGKDIDPEFLSLKRKVRLFGTHNLDSLYLMGPHSAIVGRSVQSFPAVPSSESVSLLSPKYKSTSRLSKRVRAYIEGSLTNQQQGFDVENTKIAIAVNGFIVNTTNSTSVTISELGKGRRINGHRQIEKDGNVHFLTRIPLKSWSSSENDISVHVINEDSEGKPVSLSHFPSKP